MSIHIEIDKKLEALEHPASTDLADLLVEGEIVQLYTSSKINSDEFKHYCERLRRICQRRKEAA